MSQGRSGGTGRRDVGEGGGTEQLSLEVPWDRGVPVPTSRRGVPAPAPAREPVPARLCSAVRIAEALGRHLPTPEQVAVIEAPVAPLLVSTTST